MNRTGVSIMLAIVMMEFAQAPPAAFAGLAPNADALEPAADAPAADTDVDAAALDTIEYAA